MQERTKEPLLGIALGQLRQRAQELEEWLLRDHAVEIKRARHLDGGTWERASWHHGYATALRDALRLITGDSDKNNPNRPS